MEKKEILDIVTASGNNLYLKAKFLLPVGPVGPEYAACSSWWGS